MNELRHLEEFQKILQHYRLSGDASRKLAEVQLVLLAAPTSAGRNTIIGELLKTGKYHYITSDTTRKPRINDGILEQDGEQYWFRSEEEILEDLEAGKYLEAAIIHSQQVSGISLREIEAAKAEGKIAITDIEIVGVETIVAAKPDTIVIFVVPPTFEVWQKRIFGRGIMDVDEYRRRLESSLKEFKHALTEPYYHFVVNDTLHHAVEQIDNVAHGHEAKDKANREIVEQLCNETEKHLSSGKI